jgi:CRISPR-associated endonuclease/helicase Cas3
MPAPRRAVDGASYPERARLVHEMCWAKTTEDGKPGINVLSHCLNVGCVAEALLASFSPQLHGLLPLGVTTLAALHDVGKLTPGFQGKCEHWRVQHKLRPQDIAGCEQDHAKVSQASLQSIFGDALRFWAAIAGSHHGGVKGDRVQAVTETSHEHWNAERRRLVTEVDRLLGPLPDQTGSQAAYWLTAGLITVADWIGSDEAMFPQTWSGDIEERRQCARKALQVVRWTLPMIRTGLGFSDLFPLFYANPLQSASWKNITTQGLYILEGPMGWGKTEAALAAAYRLMDAGCANGIYFALPTQVTSNRIHLRVASFLAHATASSPELRLIHSGSWLVQPPPMVRLRATSQADTQAEDHAKAGRSWFASSKRALLSPFGVGTIDQALLGIVAAKHFFVRQFGLAGKVVILDEVHTYDLYTSTLIDVLIRRLLELRCTVIVLSATLTQARRRELLAIGDSGTGDLTQGYPLLSCASDPVIEVPIPPPPSKTVAIKQPSPETLVESALDRARNRECVVWIRNTVDEAQATYGALKSANYDGGPEIVLLHSRFPQFRREELECDWIERLGKEGRTRPKSGCVLVSTQVVEQSVDIDGDLLITDLAPTDMLLQRIGRLWRHERDRPCIQPEVWIRGPGLANEELQTATVGALLAALGKSGRVYAPYVLLRSWQQWQGRDTITIPDDIRDVLEATYAEPLSDEPTAWAVLRRKMEDRRAELARNAVNATNVWFQPALADDENVQTRYSNHPTASLLIARAVETVNARTVRLFLLRGETVIASGRDWNIEVARAIHRNVVKLPRWAIEHALTDGSDWQSLYLDAPSGVGLIRNDGALHFLGRDESTGLSYCHERGVVIAAPQPAIRTRTESRPHDDESYD